MFYEITTISNSFFIRCRVRADGRNVVGCDLLLLAHGHHLVLPVSVLQLWAPVGFLWPGMGWRKLRRRCHQCLVNQWLSVVVWTIFLVRILRLDWFLHLGKYVGKQDLIDSLTSKKYVGKHGYIYPIVKQINNVKHSLILSFIFLPQQVRVELFQRYQRGRRDAWLAAGDLPRRRLGHPVLHAGEGRAVVGQSKDRRNHLRWKLHLWTMPCLYEEMEIL